MRWTILLALLLGGCSGRGKVGGDSATQVDPDTVDVLEDSVLDTPLEPEDTVGDPDVEPPVDVEDGSGDVPVEEIDVEEHGECTSSLDCGGRPCVRVPDEPGGYWLCKVEERREATDCSSTDPWVDQCCDSFECISGANGGCFYSDWGWGFCGGGIMPHNTCVYDECDRHADCTGGPNPICVPRDVQDWPRRRCAYGTCRTSLDCTREDGGFCAPLFDFCCDWRIAGFFCIYPGECQYHTDCSDPLAGCVGDPSTGGTRCEVVHCPL